MKYAKSLALGCTVGGDGTSHLTQSVYIAQHSAWLGESGAGLWSVCEESKLGRPTAPLCSQCPASTWSGQQQPLGL